MYLKYICISGSQTSSNFDIFYHKKPIWESWQAQWASWVERFFCQSRQGLVIHHPQSVTIELDRPAKRKDKRGSATLCKCTTLTSCEIFSLLSMAKILSMATCVTQQVLCSGVWLRWPVNCSGGEWLDRDLVACKAWNIYCRPVAETTHPSLREKKGNRDLACGGMAILFDGKQLKMFLYKTNEIYMKKNVNLLNLM